MWCFSKYRTHFEQFVMLLIAPVCSLSEIDHFESKIVHYILICKLRKTARKTVQIIVSNKTQSRCVESFYTASSLSWLGV